MSHKLPLILLIALVAYALGFLVATRLPAIMPARPEGEALGRRNEMKASREAAPIAAAQEMTFEYISPEVKAGQEVSVVVRATPGQVCTIWYVNPSQLNQTIPLPIYQKTGPDGRCAWKWKLPSDSRAAVATVSVWAGGKPLQRSFNILP